MELVGEDRKTRCVLGRKLVFEDRKIEPGGKYSPPPNHHHYLTFLEMSMSGWIKRQLHTITIQVARLGGVRVDPSPRYMRIRTLLEMSFLYSELRDGSAAQYSTVGTLKYLSSFRVLLSS